MSELARRYAQALWQVSPDGEALERTARALMEEPALWEALCSPAVQAGEKGRVLARLPGLEEGGPLPHFYRLLAEKGRMALLPEIVEAFHGLELARRGGARCVLTCVRPLEAEELEKLRAALCRLHHKKEVVFDVRTDPALLGGFTLDIEGVRYDKSVPRGAGPDGPPTGREANGMRAKPEEIVSVLREEIQNYDTRVRRDETGTVLEVGDGIATVYGLDQGGVRRAGGAGHRG